MDKEKIISVGSMVATVVVMVAVGIVVFKAVAIEYVALEQRMAELEDYKDQWGGQPQWRTLEIEQQEGELRASMYMAIALICLGLTLAFLCRAAGGGL